MRQESASRLKEEQASDESTRDCAQFFEECSPLPLCTFDCNECSSSASRTRPGALSSPQSTQTISCPHMVQKFGKPSSSMRLAREKERVRPTVGSCPMSDVTPAVSPADEAISLRMTHAEGASSEKEQVRQANSSLLSALSSRGNRRLELAGLVAVRDQ
jgi:hypothetical protein